jgi:hypothetical protein
VDNLCRCHDEVRELVVRMVAYNDVGDESSQSLTLPEAVDGQHV